MVLRRRGRARRRPRHQPPLFSYSRWDGTQTGTDLDADRVFDELADDFLYHGDIDSALRRLGHINVRLSQLRGRADRRRHMLLNRGERRSGHPYLCGL